MAEETNEEPLSGYVCSSFGKTAAARLRAAEAKGCEKKAGGTRKKLIQSDILFISGHHYARLGEPLNFDAIRLDKFGRLNASRVRLIMVSSCAGLRENARRGFRRKFPNAHIFGWITASPLNQKGMMSRFIASIDSRINISTNEGMEKLIQKWRSYIESLAAEKTSVSPYGLGYATHQGELAYYIHDKGSWKWVIRVTRSKR